MKMIEKYKKAIVTGGAGFIGSHIVEELLNEGLEVISIDDYSSGKKENLNGLRENPKLLEVNCDVTNYNELKKYFEGVDIVYHEAASKMNICLKDPRRDLLVNGTGTFNILELCRDFKVKKLVHASTGSVYGEGKILPETEEHPYNPVSYYGVSKLAGDRYVRLFSEMYDMDCTILRYFHVYGPRQENSDLGGVVSIFARKAFNNEPLIIYGDGTQQRSFTYVKDLVAINKLVAMVDGTKGEAYNCASGINITVGELAEKVKSYFSKDELPIEYKDWKIGDIKKFEISNDKIKKLGFNFSWSFDEGLKETLEWYKEYFKDNNK